MKIDIDKETFGFFCYLAVRGMFKVGSRNTTKHFGKYRLVELNENRLRIKDENE